MYRNENKFEIYKGDCLDLMKNIPDKSIDMILCDLPYGVTSKNKWDNTIPYEPLWKEYNRIIKDNGPIILFGQDKFTAKTMLSNIKHHRYNLIWKKVLPSGFLNANRMPLREHEDIMVFYKKLPNYNPQMTEGKPSHSRGNIVGKSNDKYINNNNYNNYKAMDTKGNLKHPTSILEFAKPHPSIALHPTQKPTELLVWLIKSFSNEGDIILDNCMGSGSTGEAAAKTNRGFIGIEIEQDIFNTAQKRLQPYLKNQTKETKEENIIVSSKNNAIPMDQLQFNLAI